jgi:hypothetical protein
MSGDDIEKTPRSNFVFAAEDEMKIEPEEMMAKADKHNPNIPTTLNATVNLGEPFKLFDTYRIKACSFLNACAFLGTQIGK